MTESERILFDKAAVHVYSTLLASHKPDDDGLDDTTIEKIAGAAWRYAGYLLKTRHKVEAVHCERILQKYQGQEAVMKIVDFEDLTRDEKAGFVRSCMKYPEPLKHLAGAAGNPRIVSAITRFLAAQSLPESPQPIPGETPTDGDALF